MHFFSGVKKILLKLFQQMCSQHLQTEGAECKGEWLRHSWDPFHSWENEAETGQELTPPCLPPGLWVWSSPQVSGCFSSSVLGWGPFPVSKKRLLRWQLGCLTRSLGQWVLLGQPTKGWKQRTGTVPEEWLFPLTPSGPEVSWGSENEASTSICHTGWKRKRRLWWGQICLSSPKNIWVC